MSDRTALFQDILKGLANSSSLSGKSVLLTDSNGNLGKSNASVLEYHTACPDVDVLFTSGFYQPLSNANGAPIAANSSDQIIFLGRNNYGVQLYIPINGETIYKRAIIAGEWRAWSKLVFTKIE